MCVLVDLVDNRICVFSLRLKAKVQLCAVYVLSEICFRPGPLCNDKKALSPILGLVGDTTKSPFYCARWISVKNTRRDNGGERKDNSGGGGGGGTFTEKLGC